MPHWIQRFRSTPGLLALTAGGLLLSLWIWPNTRSQLNARNEWRKTQQQLTPTLQEIQALDARAEALHTQMLEQTPLSPEALVRSLPIPPEQKKFQHLMTPEQIRPGLASEQYRLHASNLSKAILVELIHTIDQHKPQWKVIGINLATKGSSEEERFIDVDLTIQHLSAFNPN